ncbi:CsgG/HfaB family protein [Campylobacter troglodytis]|uniref:CsgG/HfaB family protein n=1 Tax=Campylobacter troglodytis TaxID=654363 RepID=UPI0011590AB4|nr:CsgG/HfaB family protein [Campylobacter troglodytis]TQR54338.1 hypothetical protein DMC01_10340 [Campylobacter troglodytis]
MKKIFLTFFCAVFLLALPTDNIEITDLNINSALTQNVTVSSKEGTFIKLSTGEGSANTREEAIRNALSEAISKMRGFSTENFTVQSQDIPTQSGFVQRLNTQIYKASKGRIDSYEITSIEEKENGSFLARVTVFKTLFTKDEKPTVAIFNASAYKDLGDSLQQRLTNELVQGKKFKILDRKNSAYYKAEKELMQSEDASGEDLYKLGNVLGADYMLVFNLRELGASSKGSKSANITVKDDAEVIRGDVVVDYRLILFATRELKASNTLTMSIKLKDSSIKSNEEAMSKIAKAIFVDLSDTLNPLFVSMVDGKEVLFEEKLELGSFYDCVSQTSTSSGKIQITKSNAKNSQAQILKGEVGLGDLCKLALENGKDATYVLGSNGGVSLGW